MTPAKKALLKTAFDFCQKNDKSTEFMLQYMQDVSGCSLDEVLEYLSEMEN